LNKDDFEFHELIPKQESDFETKEVIELVYKVLNRNGIDTSISRS
jgi:hypothetical protein